MSNVNMVGAASGAGTQASTKPNFEQFISAAKSGRSEMYDSALSTIDGGLDHSTFKKDLDAKHAKAKKAVRALANDPVHGESAKLMLEKIEFTQRLSRFHLNDANLGIVGKVFTGMATTLKSLMSLQ